MLKDIAVFSRWTLSHQLKGLPVQQLRQVAELHFGVGHYAEHKVVIACNAVKISTDYKSAPAEVWRHQPVDGHF